MCIRDRSDTQQLESVKRRAARFTMKRYCRTSSVGAMLAELNWGSLASRCHNARLVLFHKIHYGLVAVNMPLELKYNSGPTRTENSLAYHIPASSVDYQKNSFFLPYSQRLELSSWWSCLYIDPWAFLGLHPTINYVCGTPLILVKGSHDPSARSQRHISILIST